MRVSNHRKAADARVRAICAALALLACMFGVRALAAGTDGMLRVRLTRLGSPSEIRMRADCDYRLSSDSSVVVPAGTDMCVSASGGELTLSAGAQIASLGASAKLARDGSGHRGLSFTSPALSNRFCGDLMLRASGDVVHCALYIYVEDYLYGVVGNEMSPSSGLEALKAQSIVARNYALMRKSERSGASYDLSDAGDALSFRGYTDAGEYADVLRAVDDTRGQLVYYGERPATCYFCESNGGQIESSANAMNAPLPYSEVRDDPYDYDGTGVRKTAKLRRDGSGLRDELKAALIASASGQLEKKGFSADPAAVRITGIEDVVAGNPRFDAPSRLYRTLTFSLSVEGETVLGEARQAQVTASVPTYGGFERWYELSINDEDNETVWVRRTDRAFEITFRRSGSGVGMSRRGAQAMALKGLSCETILEYYYPGTQLVRLELSDAAGSVSDAMNAPTADPIATARLSQKCRLYQSADDSVGALTTLPAGATVNVYAVRGDWAAIGSGDLYGFIHADALASFRLAGVSVVQLKDAALAQVTGGATDLLQFPVATAGVLEHVPNGSTVRLGAFTEEWALVATDSGAEGFIPRSALTLRGQSASGSADDIVAAQDDLYALLTSDAGLYVNADDSIDPTRILEEGTRVQVLAYNQSWACVRAEDNLTGFVKLNALAAVQQSPGPVEEEIDGGPVTVVKGKVYRYVAAEALSVFANWSVDSEVLATLTRGERVRLGAYNDKWACVRVGDMTGFMLRSGLSETKPLNGTEQIEGGAVHRVKGVRHAVVAADASPLYPSWSASDEPIALLDAGTRVRVGAYNDVWACVRADDMTGFMRVEVLLPDDSGTTE